MHRDIVDHPRHARKHERQVFPRTPTTPLPVLGVTQLATSASDSLCAPKTRVPRRQTNRDGKISFNLNKNNMMMEQKL